MPTANPQSPGPNPQPPTKAMILAAGEGTRLRPLTLETPKVLLPIRGIPLIQYTLAWLKSHGIFEVAINLHHLGDKIEAFLGDGSRFGVTIQYSPETELLGTAGGVKKMEGFFDATFAVIYGDMLTDFNLSAMIDFHKKKKAMATLALFEAPDPHEVGVVEMDEDRRILRLVEKPQSPVPSPQSPVSSPQSPTLANGAVYVLQRDVLDHIPSQVFSDFAYHIFPRLIELGMPLYGYVLKNDDYLIDMGTGAKYDKANEDVIAGKVRISPV